MKRELIVATLLLATAALATHTSVNSMPYENPRYGQYVETNSHERSQKFRDAVKRWEYQQAQSPYLLVRSPYGKRPWNQPYGDDAVTSIYNSERNPFFGFQHDKQYVCDGLYDCRKKNVFRDVSPRERAPSHRRKLQPRRTADRTSHLRPPGARPR